MNSLSNPNQLIGGAPLIAAGMQWPPDFAAAVMRRAKMQAMLRDDRTLQIQYMLYYRTHPVEWIEDWGYTFDPRLQGMKKVPFILFPRQKQFVKYLHQIWKAGESGLAEKCRDIGASWLCVAFSVWLWIFHPGSTIGWGSRKAEYVDNKGDPKAIFTKIRQYISLLPQWQLPASFSMEKHATLMKIINPENDSTITGEAGDGIGRGGRTSIYFKDESAHYERPEEIEAALGDNTNVQIDISSVNGSSNVFYRRRMAGEVWAEGKEMPHGRTWVFIFDWRDHPGKTQAWYDTRRAKADAEGLLHIFAQEVDRDYSGSVEGIIIPAEWVRAAIGAHIKLEKLGNWFEGDRMAGQDCADGGGDRNALVGRHGSVVKNADHWGGEAGDAPGIAIPLCVEHRYNELYYDSIGVGAGFKTTINVMVEQPSWPRSLRVMKWNASASPLDPDDYIIPGDDQSPTNADQYGNLKAQSAFRLRARFSKTYKAVTRGDVFPVEEMISFDPNLPHLHELVMECSQPVKKTGTNGKTIVDKKPKGARSPNLFDGLNMCFNPTREVSIYDVTE